MLILYKRIIGLLEYNFNTVSIEVIKRCDVNLNDADACRKSFAYKQVVAFRSAIKISKLTFLLARWKEQTQFANCGHWRGGPCTVISVTMIYGEYIKRKCSI